MINFKKRGNMKVIIKGIFKDTKQKFFVDKKNNSDSLKRTLLKERATVFISLVQAKRYLEKLAQESIRFDECEYIICASK